MKAIAVDVGNSKVACGLIEGSDVLDRCRFDATDPSGGGHQGAVAAAFDWCTQRLLLEPDVFGGGAMASVVPTATELWARLWQGKPETARLPLLVVDHTCDLPFTMGVRSPETVGADRLCNVAAAAQMGHASAVVIDLGTANTYDILRQGIFVGGLIAPGCAIAHRALLDAGAQLPPLPFTRPDWLAGRDTQEAILAGSYHQSVGGIRAVTAMLLESLGDVPVFLTGGMAELVAVDLPRDLLYDPDLTLRGAVRLLERATGFGPETP